MFGPEVELVQTCCSGGSLGVAMGRSRDGRDGRVGAMVQISTSLRNATRRRDGRVRGWRNGMKQVRWLAVQEKCFGDGRVLLVAVGSLRNAARKLQVTIKDDRSVVRGEERCGEHPFP